MLYRPSECNTRTPNDVRIYANKAAFEGQALRSMFNGLQARTKYKLSTEMSQFAERCYEERLLFYVSEAILICVRDDAGRIKAKEILDGIEENDERELRVVWTPLLDECAETLSLKSMESSRIRLSKMSDLWNKRTNQKNLRNVFNKFVRYGARQDMTKVDGCREFLQDMIRSTAEIAANCYSIASDTPEFSTEIFQTVADKGLTDYIVEIYTWGNVIYRHFLEITRTLFVLNIEETLSFYDTWPSAIREMMQRNDLHDFVNKQRTPLNEMERNEIAHSFTRRALARLQMQSSVPACKTFVNTHFEEIVNDFFKSLNLEVDVDYFVCIDKGKNEPALTIVFKNGIRDGYGLLQFIQLRHACAVTSYALPRAYGEVTPQVQSKTDKSSQQSWNSTFLHIPYLFGTTPAKADPEIERLLELKRRLHSQIHRLSEIAHIVHILRKPLTTDSPRDVRCDGFVEQIRNRVEDVRNQIQAINDRLVKADLSGWPIASPGIIKNLAKLHGVLDYQKLSFAVENILKRLGRKSRIGDWELVEEISKALILNEDAQKNWIDLNRNQNLKEWKWMYALSSDAISEGTHYLQYLKHVQLPADYFSNHIQASDRYLGDCQFYVPNNTHFDENALFDIDGTSRENFAELNRFSKYENTEIAVLLSFKRKRPTFFFLNRTYERLSRDLIQNGVIPCSNYNEILWPTYEDLNLPLIYNSSLTLEDFEQVDPLNLFFELQSAMMEFGSAQWMRWIKKMLHHYYRYRQEALSDGVLFKVLSLYHRSIAEKEACLRDEKVITRIRKAFADQSRQVESQYDEMLMDAFVNDIVETINRGDRLVEIKPPFNDDATAEKLARFIRSRRMQPIRDEKDNLKFHI